MQISADEDQPGAGLSAPHARRQVAALPLLPLAAQRRVDAETLARLRALNAELAREVERLAGSTGPRRARAMEQVMALNLELHHLVTAASGNRRLVRLLEETLDLTALQPVLLAGSDAELQRAVREHAL